MAPEAGLEPTPQGFGDPHARHYNTPAIGPGAGFEPCSPRSQRGALTGYATTRSPGALGWIRTSDPGGRSSLLFSAELRAHYDGAPGGTRTHIFLSITFVSVRSGGGY